MKIGILALQGDFERHHQVFASCGGDSVEVRTVSELQPVSGLVIPGGESTTLTKLMTVEMRAALLVFGSKRPVWGTCAGMIMVSQTEADARVKPLGLIDLKVNRNGFGRQVHSFEADVYLDDALGRPELALNGVFIRAPRIEHMGANCTPLAWLEDEVVCAREQNIMVSSFHPELSDDDRLHRYFLSLCR